MSRKSRSRRRRARQSKPSAARPVPGSGFRDYLARCEFSGVEPVDFPEFLERAKAWREQYEPAKDRGDFQRMQELEALLCV